MDDIVSLIKDIPPESWLAAYLGAVGAASALTLKMRKKYLPAEIDRTIATYESDAQPNSFENSKYLYQRLTNIRWNLPEEYLPKVERFLDTIENDLAGTDLEETNAFKTRRKEKEKAIRDHTCRQQGRQTYCHQYSQGLKDSSNS